MLQDSFCLPHKTIIANNPNTNLQQLYKNCLNALNNVKLSPVTPATTVSDTAPTQLTMHKHFGLPISDVQDIVQNKNPYFVPLSAQPTKKTEDFLDTNNFDLLAANCWLKRVVDYSDPQSPQTSYSLKRFVDGTAEGICYASEHNVDAIIAYLTTIAKPYQQRFKMKVMIEDYCPRTFASLTVYGFIVYKSQNCHVKLECTKLDPIDKQYYVLGTVSISGVSGDYPPLEKLANVIIEPVLSKVTCALSQMPNNEANKLVTERYESLKTLTNIPKAYIIPETNVLTFNVFKTEEQRAKNKFKEVARNRWIQNNEECRLVYDMLHETD